MCRYESVFNNNMENPQGNSSNATEGELPTSWCHPGHKVHRFVALILMCFLCFGSYFCYDTPGSLADNFKGDTHLNTSQFTMLYSIYSWPNIILCFVGGYLIDSGTDTKARIMKAYSVKDLLEYYLSKDWLSIFYRNLSKIDSKSLLKYYSSKSLTEWFGVRLGTIIYMTIVLIGAIVFAFGAYLNAFWLMILGRFIFGIGGESLQVAVNNYVVLWFKGKELNMVFGLQLSFSRFGSTVNFWVMEPIYKWVSNYYSGYERLGVTLFLASLTCLLSLVCGLILGWMDHRAERILARDANSAQEEPFRLKDILKFKSVYWLLSVICVAYYLAIFPFIALGKLFFERKFDYDPQDANTVNSMVYLLSAALSPFFGILIDKTGRNVMWVIISILTTVAAHCMLSFTYFNPYIGVVSLGISYSLLAAGLWPLVALMVPESQLGTAYGICQAVQNLGLATVIILAGVIVDKYGYLMLEMFFLVCLFISLVAAILIYIIDSASNGVLNLSPSERDQLDKTDTSRIDETTNLLINDQTEDEEHDGPETRRPPDGSESTSYRDPSLNESDRIRSKYLSQILPASPDRLP